MLNFCLWYLKEFLRGVSRVFWAPTGAVSMRPVHCCELPSALDCLPFLGIFSHSALSLYWLALCIEALPGFRLWSPLDTTVPRIFTPKATCSSQPLCVHCSWPAGNCSSSPIFSSLRSHHRVVCPPWFGPFRFYTKRCSPSGAHKLSRA